MQPWTVGSVPRALFPVDLHAHTTRSDGELSPTQLVELAAHAGVEALAITDHDTTAGLTEAHSVAATRGIRIVNGIEISAWHGREIHVLGFFVDPTNEALRAVVAQRHSDRRVRIREIADRLDALGRPIDIDEVLEAATGNVGRPHVARALVAAGHVTHYNDAFRLYLGRDRPAYVPSSQLAVADAIALTHQAGGVAVIAHPALEGIDDAFECFVEAGLDGIEARHPAHTSSDFSRYRRIALRLGICTTGGSDFHHLAGRAYPGACGIDRAGLALLEARSDARRASSHYGAPDVVYEVA